jgi:hypothetical protein
MVGLERQFRRPNISGSTIYELAENSFDARTMGGKVSGSAETAASRKSPLSFFVPVGMAAEVVARPQQSADNNAQPANAGIA